MNLTKKLSLVLAAAATICVVHADTPAGTDSFAATEPSVGTLGQRYGELGFTDQNIKSLPNDFYNLDFGINYPIAKHIDLGASYSYGWLFNTIRQRSSSLNIGSAVYTTLAGVKPYLALNLGHEWDRLSETGFFSFRTDFATWGLGAGIEVPVGPVALTPYVNYQDDFQGSAVSGQAYDYGAEVNYWFRKSWAVFADIGYQNVLHSNFDAWYWTVGLRQKF